MTWQEFAVSRQFLAEERVGKAVRQVAEEEDAIFARNRAVLQQKARAR